MAAPRIKIPQLYVHYCKVAILAMVLLCDSLVTTTRGRPIQGSRTEDYDLLGHSKVDGCDFTVRDSTQRKGVYNIAASCLEGRVDWKHPYGAIRISLQPPTLYQFKTATTAPSPKGFEACILATSHMTTVKMHLEGGGGEDLQALMTLSGPSAEMEKELCLQSTSQDRPIVLYMEAEADLNSTTTGEVQIEYAMSRKTMHAGSQDDDECRPCTEEEQLMAVCTSDFVAVGTIEEVSHRPGAAETDLLVDLSRVYREKDFSHAEHMDQTNFQQHLKAMLEQEQWLYQKYSSPNALHYQQKDTSETMSRTSLPPGRHKLIAPYKCRIKRGEGHFLFIGQTKFKRNLLRCAPRLEEFQQIWTQALKESTNPCSLD